MYTGLVPLLQKHKLDARTYIQSFDWRTLIAIKARFPRMRTVALLDDTTITDVDKASGVSGYPWLGGLDLARDFAGDFVAAAASIGAVILSPVHGVPSSATVNTPGYVSFVNRTIVERAHKLNMQVVPWTVDDESTIAKLLLADGVDSIISNYPKRVMYVARELGYTVGKEPTKRKEACLAKSVIA